MDKLYAIKIRQSDGTYGDEIPINVLAQNVDWDSSHTLVDILGVVDTTSPIQSQINNLVNTKASQADVNLLETRVDNIIANAGDDNTEIVDARVGANGTTYSVLKNRLDAEHTDVKSAINDVEDDFYKLSSELVIEATDDRTYETAPSNTIDVSHPYAFKAGRKYKLEVTVNSAMFKAENNTLRADTSRVVGSSTAGLNTALLRINISEITDGAVFIKEFVALDTDVNLLMRYRFAAGTQSISVKVYEYTGTNEELDALELRVDACEDNIAEIKDAIQTTTVCIDATDAGSYETAPTTRSFAHPYPFVAGKKYKATLTVNAPAFLVATDAIRIQQSASEGTSTGNLLGYVFRIDNTNTVPIVAGAVYETEFVAAEGCVNLLARYKFSAGSPELDLDVTLTEYITADVDVIKEDVQKKYDDCIIKSRMLMGAHRGAEYFAPPNCVAAYEIAGRMGFPWAWLAQIRWSVSGTLYVMHDEDVSITTNGTGNMAELSDEYINGLLCNKISSYDYTQFTDDDLRVPTLEKAIQICLRYGMKMCFRIEPFPNQITTELHQTIWDNFERLVKEYGISADWCCYSGYNAAEMVRCITLFGENAELCPYIGSVSAQDVVDWFNAITSVTVKRKSVLLNASNVTLADVKLLHTNGIKVYAFTNSTSPTQEQMEQLATWGVDILQNPRYARIPIT